MANKQLTPDEEIALLSQEIRNLQADLTADVSPIGDWKLNKVVEYERQGLPSPYTPEKMSEYYAKRQEARDRINECQDRIKELEDERNA